MAAYTFVQNMFAQDDKEGNREVLFDEIIDARKSRMKDRNKFDMSPHITKVKHNSTAGWDILIEWKNGFTTWNSLKDVKDSFPIQKVEYELLYGLSKEPGFKWWVPDVIRRRERCDKKTRKINWEDQQQILAPYTQVWDQNSKTCQRDSPNLRRESG